MICKMLDYLSYFLLAVGLSVLLTATFRRLRGDESQVAPSQDDVEFGRRIAAIERQFQTKMDIDSPRSDTGSKKDDSEG